MKSWLRLALRSDITGRGLRTALIVGTALTAIYYGDIIVNGTITPTILAKIFANYLVPFCVSAYASVDAIINKQ